MTDYDKELDLLQEYLDGWIDMLLFDRWRMRIFKETGILFCSKPNEFSMPFNEWKEFKQWGKPL